MATGDLGDVDLTIIVDGDLSVSDVNQLPQTAQPSREHGVVRLPAWELENVFLSPTLLATLSQECDHESLEDLLWATAENSKDALGRTAGKTLARNALRNVRTDKRLRGQDLTAELAEIAKAHADLDFDAGAVQDRVEWLIETRDWLWVPGKELLALFVEQVPDFWVRLRGLDPEARRGALAGSPEMAAFVTVVQAGKDDASEG